MHLRPTTPAEILRHIKQPNRNKSVVSDEADAKFVMIVAEIILHILALLCIACFYFGIFSTSLKIPRILPIYKSGDKTNLTNYTANINIIMFLKIIGENCALQNLQFF